MPSIDPAALAPVDRYRLVIGCVVPRPIAWVTTLGASGVLNAAPFSFFNGVTARPPTVMISIGHREPPKDTLANLRASGEAVVQLPAPGQLDAVHQSGAEYRSSLSEAEVLGLATLPSEVVAPPRLAGCPIAFECRLVQEVPIGEPAASACFLEILRAHVDDAVAGADGLPDPERLVTLARLGERAYLAAGSWDVAHRDKQVLDADQRRPR